MGQPGSRPDRGTPGGDCGRPDLARLLPRFDDLPIEERCVLFDHARACPDCGPQLELLVRAQAWFEGRGTPTAAGVCPSADELYDFGRGPGARRIGGAERLSVAAHVASCADCGALVETLRARPPSPLLQDTEANVIAAGPQRGTRAPIALKAWRDRRVWVPAAAAAAVAITFAIWSSLGPSEPGVEVAAASIRFPEAPLLRGESPGALWFPRERVLDCGGGLFAPLAFELEPQARAQVYSVRLVRHSGGAFDAGQDVARLSSEVPAFEWSDTLEPGFYTWEAWAQVDGLDVYLGRRDFEVVRDAALCAEIEARRGATEPARSESILHLLAAAGFAGDARAYARGLPASPARDAFLERPKR